MREKDTIYMRARDGRETGHELRGDTRGRKDAAAGCAPERVLCGEGGIYRGWTVRFDFYFLPGWVALVLYLYRDFL